MFRLKDYSSFLLIQLFYYFVFTIIIARIFQYNIGIKPFVFSGVIEMGLSENRAAD
jgi:hypothetical protein